MDIEDKKNILRTIAAVAWADGDVSEAEKEKLTEICKNIGEVDTKDIDGIISESKEIDPILPKIKDFEQKTAVDLMTFCYRMAMKDNKMHKNELATIEKIVSQFVPDYHLPLAMKWLKHVYFAEDYFLELFVLPNYKL